MHGFRLLGLMAIIPATLLLTASFFVLFTLRKIEAQGLKIFGYVITALLWIAALLVFSLGVYVISSGRHPIMEMMKQGKGCPMQQMMGYEHMSRMMQQYPDKPRIEQ
jgi:uncharacterized membrane protein